MTLVSTSTQLPADAVDWSVRPDVDDGRLRARLRELIAALDRRVPQLDRVGEHRIAGDAALLRARAEERLLELEARPPAASVAAPAIAPVVAADCPLCHSPAPVEFTCGENSAWRCPVCYQHWNVERLATVAAYAAFCTTYDRRPPS